MVLPPPPPPQTEREGFYLFCRDHLAQRDGGGYISKEAARLFRKNLDSVAESALDSFPERRIDRKVLERYDIVPQREVPKQEPVYPAAASGYEYKYRRLMKEAIIDGEPRVLVDWKPTWEPIANVSEADMRSLHNMKRKLRAARRHRKPRTKQ